MTVAIRTSDLSKRYGGLVALDRVSLSVERGEVFGYLGANGAGKTTTIGLLTGLLRPTAGQAEILGAGIHPASHKGTSEIGVVFGDNLAPEPSLTPLGYLRYIGRLYGLPTSEIDARASELASHVRLGPLRQRIGTLSSGQRRKVELMRALLHEPEVLLLDEPTRELDIPSRQAIWTFLRGLADDGVSIFICSHDPLEVQHVCDRVALLRKGTVAWQGQAEDIDPLGEGYLGAIADRLAGDGVTFDPVDR